MTDSPPLVVRSVAPTPLPGPRPGVRMDDLHELVCDPWYGWCARCGRHGATR